MTWTPLWKEGPIKALAKKLETRREKRRARRLRTMAEMDAWMQVRQDVWRRDRGYCRSCGRAVWLQHADPFKIANIHHIEYRSAGGSNESYNLVTLCIRCHDLEHRRLLEIVGNADIYLGITLKHPDSYRIIETRESPCPT